MAPRVHLSLPVAWLLPVVEIRWMKNALLQSSVISGFARKPTNKTQKAQRFSIFPTTPTAIALLPSIPFLPLSVMVNAGIWSEEEHDRFLIAIKQFPNGPWAAIAEAVGTRSVRQVQTHTQKYYEKIMRRMTRVRKDRKTWARLEHRIEDDILEFCKMMHSSGLCTSLHAVTKPEPLLKSPIEPKCESVRGAVTASPTQALTLYRHHRDPLSSSSPVIKMESQDSPRTDQEDDEVFDLLPSFEESLDFFIASLEYDVQL
ncbi:Myb-like dna-binding protein, partial [Globisporangium splendens]